MTAIAARVRDAISSGRKVRVSGAGTWMSAGRPVKSGEQVSLAEESGIVEYVPDDLTITVRAGTTLEEIADATRAKGQWLPLDPPGGKRGTIGATIATGSSGPLAHSFGFTRDLVLGLELVTGKGDVVRSGGRVVKNVAGFDLMRLNCGAWGTLGVITEASLRLYALPKVDRTFSLAMPADGAATLKFLDSLRTAPLSALAMECIDPEIAKSLGLSAEYLVLVRLAGNTELVDAQLKTISEIARPKEVEGQIWSKFAEMDTSGFDTIVRMSSLPTNIGRTWEAGHSLLKAAASGYIHSTFSRGSVRVVMKGPRNPGNLPRSASSLRVTYDALPSAVWETLSPSVTADHLSQSVKRAFDPNGILNPGILG